MRESRSDGLTHLQEVQCVPAHELPHDGERHLSVAVDDVQSPDVHHRQSHALKTTTDLRTR